MRQLHCASWNVATRTIGVCGLSGRSNPTTGWRAYFTIVADAELSPVIGWIARPLLARMFYRLNFPTFIRAAEAEQPRSTAPGTL
jgi:hypothetical protein